MYKTLFKEFIKTVPTILAEHLKDVDFEKEFNNIKDKFKKENPAANAPSGLEPEYGVVDEMGRYNIYCEMPGVSKKNVEVSVIDGHLQIGAIQDNKTYFYKIKINNDEVLKSELKLGILTIMLVRKDTKGKSIKVD